MLSNAKMKNQLSNAKTWYKMWKPVIQRYTCYQTCFPTRKYIIQRDKRLTPTLNLKPFNTTRKHFILSDIWQHFIKLEKMLSNAKSLFPKREKNNSMRKRCNPTRKRLIQRESAISNARKNLPYNPKTCYCYPKQSMLHNTKLFYPTP